MTTHVSLAHADAPMHTAADDRIHNCGWGRPSEQYRTPAIGTGFVLDLHRTLLSWDGAPAEVRDLFAAPGPRCHRYPKHVVTRYAQALITTLTGDSARATTDVRATVATLADVVIRDGLTDGVVLTCAVGTRGTQGTPLGHAVSARDAALALVTAACTRPPTVMWGIEPSLAYLTVDTVLRLRWLHRDGAGSAACSTWTSMTRIATAGATHG